MSDTQDFRLEPFAERLFLVSPWIAAGFALLGFALPFLPREETSGSMSPVLWMSAAWVLLFGGLAWYGWRIARALPHAAVSLDEQGIWITALGREAGLVPWSKITRLRERAYLQRLELLDDSGAPLLNLEYQLSGFSDLRDLVTARSALRPLHATPGHAFAKPRAYHAFYCIAVGALLAAAFYFWPDSTSASAIAGVLAALLAFEYATQVCKVRLQADELLMSRPFRTRRLRRSDILDIAVSDRTSAYVQESRVLVTCADGSRPIALHGLGLSAAELALVLNTWWRRDA